MKKWIFVLITGIALYALTSCSSSRRMGGGGGYGYYDPMYYGQPGFYHPGFYQRNDVIIHDNRQGRKTRVAPRSNRRGATVAPDNKRNRTREKPAARERAPRRNNSGNINRRATPPQSRPNVQSAPRNRSSPGSSSPRSNRRGN